MKTARAYYNYGRWVAECPEPHCADARLVYEVNPRTGLPTGRRLTEDVCAVGHPFRIDMPPLNLEAQIVAVVSQRPTEADRAWYPKDHPAALRHGQPHGQTVAELAAESEEVAAYRAAQQERGKQETLEALAALGVQVQPDGSFSGSV